MSNLSVLTDIELDAVSGGNFAPLISITGTGGSGGNGGTALVGMNQSSAKGFASTVFIKGISTSVGGAGGTGIKVVVNV